MTRFGYLMLRLNLAVNRTSDPTPPLIYSSMPCFIRSLYERSHGPTAPTAEEYAQRRFLRIRGSLFNIALREFGDP